MPGYSLDLSLLNDDWFFYECPNRTHTHTFISAYWTVCLCIQLTYSSSWFWMVGSRMSLWRKCQECVLQGFMEKGASVLREWVGKRHSFSLSLVSTVSRDKWKRFISRPLFVVADRCTYYRLGIGTGTAHSSLPSHRLRAAKAQRRVAPSLRHGHCPARSAHSRDGHIRHFFLSRISKAVGRQRADRHSNDSPAYLRNIHYALESGSHLFRPDDVRGQETGNGKTIILMIRQNSL